MTGVMPACRYALIGSISAPATVPTVYNTYTTGPQRDAAQHILNLSFNAYGGIVRYIFLSDKELEYNRDGVHFKGTRGILTIHPTHFDVALLDAGEMFYENCGLHLTAGTAILRFAPGGFVSMPAGMNHYAWATAETVVQVHGDGPFAIVYVNPADDPSKTP